jgi:hypothetical protein
LLVNLESWPTDPLQAAALVALAVNDIDEADAFEREELLHELIQRAWPSDRAQRQ